MMDDLEDRSDEALSRRLRQELPRHGAPDHLRAAIIRAARGRPPRPAWMAPALAALATAALVLLFLLPLLPASNRSDPLQRLARAVVSEHSRAFMWGARSSTIMPTASSWLTQESGITLARVFAGDETLWLVNAEPVYLERERGVALHYRDRAGHFLTYVALPAPSLKLPERGRVNVAGWRPVLIQEAGFATWVWRHGDLACFLVSDMVSAEELEHFKEYFVRVRTATEPLLAY
jgi:hypothetical protein